MSNDSKKAYVVSPPTSGYFPLRIPASALSNTIPLALPTLRRSLALQIEKEVIKNEELELLEYGTDPTKPAFAAGLVATANKRSVK